MIIIDYFYFTIYHFEALIEETVVIKESLWVGDNKCINKLDKDELCPGYWSKSKIVVDQNTRKEHSY